MIFQYFGRISRSKYGTYCVLEGPAEQSIAMTVFPNALANKSIVFTLFSKALPCKAKLMYINMDVYTWVHTSGCARLLMGYAKVLNQCPFRNLNVAVQRRKYTAAYMGPGRGAPCGPKSPLGHGCYWGAWFGGSGTGLCSHFDPTK